MTEDFQKITSDLSDTLKNGMTDQAKSLTQQALDQGMDPLQIIEKILVPTLTEIGRRFQEFEIFLPELMMAGEAAEAITAIVEKATLASGKPSLNKGTVILGQVEGDMHDIGRNIVGTLLKSHGFKVVDLGRDVPASAFLDAAEKEKADIIALSALMTTTLPAQKRTINLFSEVRKREEFFIVVGGGAVSEAWAKEVGSDGYSTDAAGAVELCKTLMKK
ncbi:MAG: cobalamin B12-binding domain-containing protein [Chloroflexi bacterium]|nr:cobalamin B12-binding domain-containing protein [Chloroflexota bacterium]